MTSKYAGFFSDLDDSGEKSVKSQKKTSKYDAFFDDIDDSPKQNVLGYAQAPIRGAAAAITSAPRAITGLLKHGSKALSKKGMDLAEREGREITPEEASFTAKMVQLFGYPDEFLEKIGLPTYGEASEL